MIDHMRRVFFSANLRYALYAWFFCPRFVSFKQINYINKAHQLKEVIDQQVESELLPR